MPQLYRNSPSADQGQDVSGRVFEMRERAAPFLLFRWSRKMHALRRKSGIGGLNVRNLNRASDVAACKVPLLAVFFRRHVLDNQHGTKIKPDRLVLVLPQDIQSQSLGVEIFGSRQI